MRYRLGDIISLHNQKNSDLSCGLSNLKGISIKKVFIETKADMTDVSLCNYLIVPPDAFAYVTITSRNGEKITIAHNDTNDTFIVSSSYVVFSVTNRDVLNPIFLFMFFNRPEFDRYTRFNSWGSAREAFSWDDMCDISIDLPPLSIQKKYVAVHNAMLAILNSYMSNIDNLNFAISAYIEELKHHAPRVPVGQLLEEIDIRNRDGAITNVQGININKEFMPSVANLSTTDITKYKVVQKNQFAANFMHVMRDEKVPLGLYHDDCPCVISPAYPVLRTKSKDVHPEYLMLWLSRTESDRYAWFASDSSVRGGLEMSRFFEIMVPLPSFEQQRAVVNLYNARHMIQRIIAYLGSLLKDICPILIKGAIEETRTLGG